MPTIDLSNSTKEIQLLNTTAIMCFPSDKEEDHRRYWSLKQWIGIAADQYINVGEKEGYSIELSKHIGSWFGEVIFHAKSWPALANAVIGPGHKKNQPAKEAGTYIVRGLITGWILKDVLSNGGGHSTAAQRFCTDDNDLIFKKLGKKPPIIEYRHIQNKIWPSYKDAAHLWAAFLDSGKNIFPKNPHRFFSLDQFKIDELSPSEPQGLKGFIKLSNSYRQKALSYFPPKGPRESLINKKSSWEIIL